MDSFEQWASDGGIQVFSVKIVKTAHAGHGLFAAKDVAANQVLMHIPQEMLITAPRVLYFPYIKPFCDKSDRVVLCLFLAHERFRAESSAWKPYVDSLPSDDFHQHNHLLHNPQWVAGTSLAEAVKAKNASLRREHSELGLNWLTINMWIWADITFWSRVVELGNGELTLAPFFDFANHSLAPNIRWEQSAGLDLVPFGEPITANTELVLSYGAKSNKELLFLHGFSIPHNTEPSTVTLPLARFLDDPQKFAWIGQNTNRMLTLDRNGWNSNAFEMMYLAVLDEDDGLYWKEGYLYLGAQRIDDLNALAQSVKSLDHFQVIELRVVVLLLDAVQHHYQELETVHRTENSMLRDYIELYVQEEKSILERAIQTLEDQQRQLMEHSTVISYLSAVQQEM
ncbi:hypothetical protein DFQ28_000299 [Apophysomyces sp. BC1034]|nr:hypothetical protein DFQ30_000564 [Apophysomyces sp. BC1015]KAG0167973.1 hypothetical protein DFQ29_000176 [Apophysomyces sp. BC1021]KAG0184010.1 hypothetical protein DFQ28_000299 [Apophysomyces sp. BC1034]